MEAQRLRRRVRCLLAFFILALVLSGVTAVPLTWEMSILESVVGEGAWMGQAWPSMAHWISWVHSGLSDTSEAYPFLFYGTDWLAFAHVVIAVAFLGPLRDPVRNVWVIEFGMIACAMVIPMALVFGPIRGIPLFWRLIDCSFGVFGMIPLWLSWQSTRRLAQLEQGPAYR